MNPVEILNSLSNPERHFVHPFSSDDLRALVEHVRAEATEKAAWAVENQFTCSSHPLETCPAHSAEVLRMAAAAIREGK